MPETNNREDRELIPAEIRGDDRIDGEPKPEVENKLPAEPVQEPQSPLTATDETEAKDEPAPGDSPGEEIDEFAESVMFGLEHAGLDNFEKLDIETLDLEKFDLEKLDPKKLDTLDALLAEDLPLEVAAVSHIPADAEDLQQKEPYDTFFAGWDGPGEEPLQEGEARAPAQEREPISDRYSLSEISLAASEINLAASPPTPVTDVGDREQDVSSKHDALADAVQSALLSVYGDGPVQGTPVQTEPRAAFSPGSRSSDWKETAEVEAERPHDDGLSPQDVILNYFSYTSGTPSTTNSRPDPASPYEDVGNQSPAQLGGRFDSLSRPQKYSAHPAAVRPYAGREEAEPYPVAKPPVQYDNRATLPVPSAQTRGISKNNVPGKENSRLLGAAAIGLIGGIAIAATLAVFVISSYVPQTQLEGPQQKQDARRGEMGDPAYGSTAPEGPTAPATAALVSPATVTARPADAQSEVVANDTVIAPGQPAALAIKVKLAHAYDQTLVSITGIPGGARLNAGVDAGGGNWLLPPRRLNGLTLNLPPDAPSLVPLEVQLLDSNVRTPLSEKKRFVVRSVVREPSAAAAGLALERTAPPAVPAFSTQTMPSSATLPNPRAAEYQLPQPPTSFRTQTIGASGDFEADPSGQSPASLAPVSLPKPPEIQPRNAVQQAEIEDLIREGNKRMREGDIIEARQFYQKAVKMGDAEAALAMGRSYDPIYFARIDKKNAEPDAAVAFDWYRKAMDSGATQTAKVRMENLKHFLNE